MPKWEYSSISSGALAAFHGPAEGVQRARAGIAGPGEDQLPGAAGGDHLIVDQVGREPAEREVAPTLADDLVPGGEADEVGEALDDDRVAVVDVRGDRRSRMPVTFDTGRRLNRRR